MDAHNHVWARTTGAHNQKGAEMTFCRFAGLIAVGSLALGAADASAQSIGDAEVAFTEGRFLEAADIAEALGTSDGYALAAKSLAVYGHYVATEEDDRDEVIDRAIRMGEDAVGRPCAPTLPTPRRTWPSPVGTPMSPLPAGLPDGCKGGTGRMPSPTTSVPWNLNRTIRSCCTDTRPGYPTLMKKQAWNGPEMLSRALDLPVRDVYEEYVHLEILDALDALKDG